MDYPVRRDLDGVYYRVKRDGHWCNRCFTDLTTAEQDDVMAPYNREQCLRVLGYMLDAMRDMAEGTLKDEAEAAVLAKSVAKQVRTLGDQLDIKRGVSEE